MRCCGRDCFPCKQRSWFKSLVEYFRTNGALLCMSPYITGLQCEYKKYSIKTDTLPIERTWQNIVNFCPISKKKNIILSE